MRTISRLLPALALVLAPLLMPSPASAEGDPVTDPVTGNYPFPVHRLTVRVMAGVEDGNDCVIFCEFEPPRLRYNTGVSVTIVSEDELLNGGAPIHDPEALRREWWRGPFTTSNGTGLLPIHDDASLCFHLQAANLNTGPNGSFHVRTRVGFFVGGLPCSTGDLKNDTFLSAGANPDGVEVCSLVWTASYTDDHAEAQICITNEIVNPIPSALPVTGNSGIAPFVTTWDMSSSTTFTPDPEWVWYWGDGTSTEGGVQASHAYEYPGVYEIVLRIDDGGAIGVAVVGIVTVHAPPTGPQADLTAQHDSGRTFTFDASASRAGTGPGAFIDEYLWDFGDGTRITTRHWDPPIVTHTYQQDGEYQVTLTIRTLSTATSTTAITVIV